MTCQLCGQDRKLVQAHVIPRSFHLIAPDDKKPARLATNAEGRYPQKIPKGVYDASILCEDCERRFSPWDDYADGIFLKSWDKFDKIVHQGKEIGYGLATYDYTLLKMFFLSLLWRAAVSSHVMFSKIELGPREPILRDSILRSEPGDIDHFGVVLQAFNSTNIGFLDPHQERFNAMRFCRFYLSHVIAFIKVDSQVFEDPFKSMALGPNRPLVLAQKDFMKSPERRIMQRLALADIERSQTKH
jgi:hypothetical protein